MTLEEQIELLESNAEFERKEGDLQGCLNFKQLAEWLKDYKRLKDQEPCDDAISRSATLEAIDVKAWEFCDYLIRNGRNDEQKPVSHFADNLRECVGEDLPSVTPQPNKWIPVSERLPEEGEMVLVTECNALGDDVRLSRWQGEAYGFTIGLVKAWMPLPKPYKAEGSAE